MALFAQHVIFASLPGSETRLLHLCPSVTPVVQKRSRTGFCELVLLGDLFWRNRPHTPSP